jgi:hypothetical protein
LSTPDGAQVGFTPDGRALLVTERGGDKLSPLAMGMAGSLGAACSSSSPGYIPHTSEGCSSTSAASDEASAPKRST